MINIREFRSHLRLLEREIVAALSGQSECCGVSGAQCHLLLELDGAGCVNLTSLAQRMQLDKSTMSRTVDSLVGATLVQRDIDPHNRRQQIICLSEAGKQKAAAINALCDAQYERLFQSISPERAEMVLESISVLATAMAGGRILAGGNCDDCC